MPSLSNWYPFKRPSLVPFIRHTMMPAIQVWQPCTIPSIHSMGEARCQFASVWAQAVPRFSCLTPNKQVSSYRPGCAMSSDAGG